MKGELHLGVRLTTGILYLLGSLPLGFHRGCARVLGWLLRRVVHYREDVVMTNLSRSFPEKSYEELVRIKKRFYRHFAGILTESVWFGACRGERGRKRLRKSHIVEFANVRELNSLYAESRQMVFLQAHTGNWELTGGLKNYFYESPADLEVNAFSTTYYPLHSRFWDKVMAWCRQAAVCDLSFEGYVPSDQVIRFAFGHRDRKYTYTFNTDQYPYWDVGAIRIPFLNQDTLVMTGSAKLACRLDTSVGYMRFRRREDGGYEMSVVPIVSHAAQSTPEEIMKTYYKLLEEDVREQPWNYLWTHKRWK